MRRLPERGIVYLFEDWLHPCLKSGGVAFLRTVSLFPGRRLVPAPKRVKPYAMPMGFETQQAAESWIHSPEGVEAIDETLEKFGGK